MSEETTRSAAWSRLDNLPTVGMNYLYTWYRAAVMEHERVVDQTRGRADRQVDAYQFVHALRQVHRSACMIRDALDGYARHEAGRAVADFEAAVPDAKNARDVLDHFDAYAQGMGNLSHPGTRTNQRTPTEQAAREFDAFYETQGPNHYIVHLGRLSVDVTAGRHAADTMVDRVLDVLGLTTSTDEGASLEFDLDNPLPMTSIFLTCLWSPLSPEVSDVLTQLVTPEVVDDRGDFSEAAQSVEGYAPVTHVERPRPDVAYVALVPDTGRVRQATRRVPIMVSWWLTLQRRTDLEPHWRAFAVSRHPIEPDDMPWPDD